MNSKKIKLVALDLDGTLFDDYTKVSEDNKIAIKEALQNGVHVIISTGRPFVGLPLDILKEIGIEYAITCNGAAIYQIQEKKCIYESCMDSALVAEITGKIKDKAYYYDVFIDGDAYGQKSLIPHIDDLVMPEATKDYIRTTRSWQDDLEQFLNKNDQKIQKMTVQFKPLSDGTLLNRKEVEEILKSYQQIQYVTGGYNNFEYTIVGTSKGNGLKWLVKELGINIEETVACGDSQNDIDIMNKAGYGVAMANATEDVKEIADYVTLSNNESGVAAAIHHFCNI